MSKLYLQINVSEDYTRLVVWTTKARQAYRLEGELVEKLPALLGTFKGRYTIKVTKAQLDREVMIQLTNSIRELGHTIAF
jgi:hypothetical protein